MLRKRYEKSLPRPVPALLNNSHLLIDKILSLNRRNMSNTAHPTPRKHFRVNSLCFGIALMVIGCSPRPYSNPEGISPSQTMEEAQRPQTEAAAQPRDQQSYVGMWLTQDGYIRHELLPNGRYDEARGQQESAYQGSYTLTGNHIDYVDDTGFTADGEFRDDVLYHGSMVLYRE